MRQKEGDKTEQYFDSAGWKIQSQVYNPKFKQFPDLVLLRGGIEKLIIELKKYNHKVVDEDNLIEDVGKNAIRCENDADLQSIVIYTSTLSEEEANRILRKMEDSVGSEREHIINVNQEP